MNLLSLASYRRTVYEEPVVIDHTNDTYNTYTVVTSNKLQLVNITKRPLMESDYSDLRFCINPNGTAAQKRYLPYWIESSDSTSAIIYVAFPTEPSVSSTFYCIWGGSGLSDVSNGYDTFSTCGGYYNDFSRGGSGLWWDVGKYYGSDKNPFEDAFWPAQVKSPFDNVTTCVVYKSSGGDNQHLATDNTYVAFSKSTNRGLTWSAPQNIFPRQLIGAIGKYMVFMNCTITWVDDGGGSPGLITAIANSNISGGNSSENQTYSRPYIVQSTDGGDTWTSPVMLIDTEDYTGMGGSATVTHDGLQLFFGHCDFPIDNGTKYCYCFYSFDNFTTVDFITYERTGYYLNETTPLQLKDSNGNWTNQVRLIIRDDGDSLLPPPANAEDWHKATLTYDINAQTVSISSPVLNDFTTPLKSRPNLCRYRMGYGRPDRIVCMGGTTVIPGWYSDDEGATWANFAVNGSTSVIADGSIYSSQRTYPAQAAFHQTGSQTDLGVVVWNSNGSISDCFVQFFDPLLFQLRTISIGTYTDSVPRPIEGDNGMKMSYHDTGSQSDPKTLSAEWWTVNGKNTPVTLVCRAKSSGAVNAVCGFKKQGESGSSFANVITFHNQSDTVYARQATDTNGLATVTQSNDVNYIMRIEWTVDFVKFYLNDVLKATKLPSNGSGIPNWNGCPYFNMRDNGSSSDYLDVDYVYVRPYGDLTATDTGYGTTTWDYDDEGIN